MLFELKAVFCLFVTHLFCYPFVYLYWRTIRTHKDYDSSTGWRNQRGSKSQLPVHMKAGSHWRCVNKPNFLNCLLKRRPLSDWYECYLPKAGFLTYNTQASSTFESLDDRKMHTRAVRYFRHAFSSETCVVSMFHLPKSKCITYHAHFTCWEQCRSPLLSVEEGWEKKNV